jgi:hypothetical protein
MSALTPDIAPEQGLLCQEAYDIDITWLSMGTPRVSVCSIELPKAVLRPSRRHDLKWLFDMGHAACSCRESTTGEDDEAAP